MYYGVEEEDLKKKRIATKGIRKLVCPTTTVLVVKETGVKLLFKIQAEIFCGKTEDTTNKKPMMMHLVFVVK